jgi:DNA-binding GntR family transcriptional regulator
MKIAKGIHRDTSLEVVLEYIRDAILDGTFQPGFQLKQSVIASQLGVSQGPTREALIRLVGEGLAENIPYHGVFVRQLTSKDVDEIYQLRKGLESLAVKIALPTLKRPEYFSQLEQLIKEMIQAEDKGDFTQAVAKDLAFHRCLVEVSGNERLINFWSSLLAQSRWILRDLYRVEREVFKESMAQNHQVILEGIKNQDSEAIKIILEEHMDYARIRVLQHLQNSDRLDSSIHQ